MASPRGPRLVLNLLAPPPVRQRRKDARPQELLDAALALFVEKGFAATRAEEVAHRAGVSKGTLYLYYTSKEELLKAVITTFIGTEIQAGAEQIDRHQGSMAEALRETLTSWWVRMYESPASGVFKLVVTEVRNFPDLAAFYHREVVEPGHQLVGRIITRGIERGEFRPVDIASAVHSLVLPLVMLCLHKHSLGACTPLEGQADFRQFIAQHIDLMVRGLRTDDAAPSPDSAASPASPAARRGARTKAA